MVQHVQSLHSRKLFTLCCCKVSREMRLRGVSIIVCLPRVLNVTGAGYADCSGLYSISNLTSIWDSKRIVFERIAGGWRPMDKR